MMLYKIISFNIFIAYIREEYSGFVFTLGQNIIGAPKMRKDYSICPYCDSNIDLFSIAPCKVIDFNCFYSFFGSALCFFF